MQINSFRFHRGACSSVGREAVSREAKMYKKQLKLQKILCLLAIGASVLIFLYALGIMTDLYDTLYSTMRNPADLTQTDVPAPSSTTTCRPSTRISSNARSF